MNRFPMYQSKYKSALTDSDLERQLAGVLASSNFEFLGEKYSGKVRDIYLLGSNRIMITSDRLSCFDVILTSVPFKGQVLNQMAVEWFKQTSHIVPNHLIDVPHPNVMIVKNCEILPIEVVVRNYLTGSAWRDYQAGRSISGIVLPKGMKKSQKFDEPLLTPATKAPQGEHDQPISESEILSSGLVPQKIWQAVREIALALFDFGQKSVKSRGLLLVDTKYEFGLVNGKIYLADEIHTIDNSRFWHADSYLERFEKGEMPVALDKEPARQWLLSQGYQGEGAAPDFTSEHRVALAKHYISSFEQVTGTTFQGEVADTSLQIEEKLRSINE